MALTITTITNAANLGGNTSVTTGSPTQTTLQAGTLLVTLTVTITQGPESFPSNLGSSVSRSGVEVWYAILPSNLAANSALPQTIFQGRNVLYCKVPLVGSSVTTTMPHGQLWEGLFNNGGYLYTWFNSPPLSPLTNVPPTITIVSTEF